MTEFQNTSLNSELLTLPDQEWLIAELVNLAQTSEPIQRYLTACDTGHFTHPDGRTAILDVVLSPSQAALLAYLAQRCPRQLSIETGFGMGSSTTAILGSRRSTGTAFEHVAFDPNPNHGAIVRSYLEKEFSTTFRYNQEISEVGLAGLLRERGAQSVGLAFIDGGHQFETVMVDFRLSDLLCCEGGYIIFDDSMLPAIETVIAYVRCNRPDYQLAHLPVMNTTVLQKCGPDRRAWSAFRPFPVAQRNDWTPSSAVAAQKG